MTSIMTWLMPESGAKRDLLATTITELAAGHNAPRFPPHITMVGKFNAKESEAVHGIQSIVTGAPSFDVTFSRVGHEQVYFRSLYLQAERSSQLTALHEAGRRIWSLDLPPYVPHLSLMYSNMPEEEKQPIIDNVNIPLPFVVHIDAVELWADDQMGVHGWRRITRMPLRGGLV